MKFPPRRAAGGSRNSWVCGGGGGGGGGGSSSAGAGGAAATRVGSEVGILSLGTGGGDGGFMGTGGARLVEWLLLPGTGPGSGSRGVREADTLLLLDDALSGGGVPSATAFSSRSFATSSFAMSSLVLFASFSKRCCSFSRNVARASFSCS